MPKASKKSRTHRKSSSGPSLGSEKTATKGKQVRGATVKPDPGIMNLPVEVFLEIVAYCRPLDLLRLSRVSTELRGVLLAKRNKSVWVSARNSLVPPMPECPEDLSEPQYASLVFDRFCTACGAVGKELKENDDTSGPDTVELTVSYAVRVRLCQQCWKTNVKAGHTITDEFDLKVRRDRSLQRVLFDLVPEAKVARERFFVGVTVDGEPKVFDVMPMDRRESDVLHQTSRQNFYQPDVVAVAKEYCALVESSGEDSKPVEEFVERRKAHTLERLDFHFAVARWGYDHYQARADANLKALQARKAAIEKRLGDLGYEPADWLRTPEFETVANHTDPLTEGAWNETQPKLLAALEPRRALRETTKFKEKYWLRASQLKAHYLAFLASSRTEHPWKRTLPHFVEASKLPCIRALVMAAPTPDAPLPLAHFAAIEARLREEAQPYCKRARRDVARIFKLALAAELGVPWDSPAELGVDGAAPDSDPEAALLDVHDALFRCSSFPCDDFSRTAMTVSGLLEHWQKGHPYEWSGGQRIWLADREKRERVPMLIEALRLPADTTLSALEDTVAAQSASPTCSCGKPIDPTMNRYEALDRLLCHLLAPQSASEGSDATQEATSVKHLITFGPAAEPTKSADGQDP